MNYHEDEEPMIGHDEGELDDPLDMPPEGMTDFGSEDEDPDQYR